MPFYYDPKTYSATDLESGIVIRPSGRFSGDAGTRYFLIDPNSDVKTDDGVGIFEFGASSVHEDFHVDLDDGRQIRRRRIIGYEISLPTVEVAFSRYLENVEGRAEKIKGMLTEAFLAELKTYDPAGEFKILFISRAFTNP